MLELKEKILSDGEIIEPDILKIEDKTFLPQNISFF